MKVISQGSKIFEVFQKENPNDETILFSTVLLFYFSKNYNKVIEILSQRTEEELNILLAFFLSCCHIKQKEYQKALKYFLLFEKKLPQDYNIENKTGLAIDIYMVTNKLEKEFPFNRTIQTAKLSVSSKLNISTDNNKSIIAKVLAYVKEIVYSNSFWFMCICLLVGKIIIKMST